MSHLSITAWRLCWAVRIMRAAPHSTMLADWVSMTQWRTCWASRGRSALHASPRTRSLPCTLPPSEFDWPPRARLCISPKLKNTDLTWFSVPAVSLLLTLTGVGCGVYALLFSVRLSYKLQRSIFQKRCDIHTFNIVSHCVTVKDPRAVTFYLVENSCLKGDIVCFYFFLFFGA